jgi:pre-mRNA-processing factor 40
LSSLSESDKEDSRFTVSPSMSDSDRQLYFADFVIELQATEDDKRRRIRDARRRAEKAQRDAYRDALEKIAAQGKLTPSTPWRDAERIVESVSSYTPVLEQDREAPREIFEEFIDEWEEIYRRDRSFLSQLVHPSSNREILVTKDTKYDEFVKAIMEEANTSPQLYSEARRITKTEEPVSSTRLYFNELVNRAKDTAASLPLRRRGHGGRRGSLHDSSSEDEGEIIEDGEVEDNAKPEEKSSAVVSTEEKPIGSDNGENDEGRPPEIEQDNVDAHNAEANASEVP